MTSHANKLTLSSVLLLGLALPGLALPSCPVLSYPISILPYLTPFHPFWLTVKETKIIFALWLRGLILKMVTCIYHSPHKSLTFHCLLHSLHSSKLCSFICNLLKPHFFPTTKCCCQKRQIISSIKRRVSVCMCARMCRRGKRAICAADRFILSQW